MASSNIKLFDENKGNMLSDSEFGISNQRLNGLQTGIASSQLQNKAMYQVSLMAYALAQIMNQNGIDANDYDAVSTFVNNLSSSLLQKVNDKASTAQAQAGTDNTKWMTPALVKAWWDNIIFPPSKINGTIPAEKGGTGVQSLAELASVMKLARIESVSYSGSGVGGSDNPNSVQFSFIPDFIILVNADIGNYNMVMYGGTGVFVSDNSPTLNRYLNFTWNGKNISWYASGAGSVTSSSLATPQYNASGENYKVIACGAWNE